ncbi:PQQ-binding-like beta-propeller repeat protein [Kitasatospora sp. NPDC050543]|uniref:outer membrane protein assembly factor BamB family protein n=1 Tax=Kitasatospora sp. NPDC050543 TaxID=3364054 RepID=UPI003793FA37
MTGHQMAGDNPTAGADDASGGGQEYRGVSLGRKPGGVDPAAVADQMTQLDGAPVVPAQMTQLDGAPVVPAQAAPPAPAAPPASTPAPGGEYAYQPTAAAFPAQSAPPAQPPVPPAQGAPVGPFDPSAQAYPTQAPPPAGGTYGGGYPAQAPGYGYPQQPGFDYPGPAVTPPKQRNPVLLFGGIIGGVLAIAIVIGLVVLFKGDPNKPGGSTGGSGNTVANAPAGSMAVTWNAPKAAGNDSTRLIGVWATDKYVVRGDKAGIRAYNLSDGQEAWSLLPPTGAKEFCTMSVAPNKNNIGAISLNVGDGDCATVAALDSATGKLLWKAGKPGEHKSFDPTLSVTDKVVSVGSSTQIGALNISDGSVAWEYKPRDKSCTLYGKAAGHVVVVSDRCYNDSTPKQQLQVMAADTGKSQGGYTLETNLDGVDGVISADPLVLDMSGGSGSDGYVLSFDSTSGKALPKLPVKQPGADSLRFSDATEPFTRNTVVGTTLYVETRQDSKQSIAAFDLAQGKKLWETNGSADQGLRLVSGVDDDKVRAIAMNGYGKAPTLVRLSPTDGAVTQIAPISLPKASMLSFSDTEIIADGSDWMLAVPENPMDSPLTKLVKK